jgi:hypothetical protein
MMDNLFLENVVGRGAVVKVVMVIVLSPNKEEIKSKQIKVV